jgi:hypothetical protein
VTGYIKRQALPIRWGLFLLAFYGKALYRDNENEIALLEFCRFFWYAGKGIGNRPAVKEMQHADNPALE